MARYISHDGDERSASASRCASARRSVDYKRQSGGEQQYASACFVIFTSDARCAASAHDFRASDMLRRKRIRVTRRDYARLRRARMREREYGGYARHASGNERNAASDECYYR